MYDGIRLLYRHTREDYAGASGNGPTGEETVDTRGGDGQRGGGGEVDDDGERRKAPQRPRERR